MRRCDRRAILVPPVVKRGPIFGGSAYGRDVQNLR